MKRPLVIVTDPIHDDGITLLREHARVIEFSDADKPQDQSQALAEADGLVVRMYGVGAETLGRCPRLKIVALHGAGVDNIEDLGELLSGADIVSLHAPLTEQTRGIIGAAELAAMKASAIIVNVSRGGMIDEAALVDALAQGRIRGAGLDVFSQEPPDTASPLFDLPNVVLAPHVIGLTEEGLRHMGVASAECVLTVLDGKRPTTLLNPQAWETRRR